VASVWDAVVGQDHAIDLLKNFVAHPVHGFLFVGPEGCGKDEAARAFASALLTGSDDLASREARLVMQQTFADVHEVRREGAAISAEQAQEIVRLASRSPIESNRVVIILHEVQFMAESAVVRLLKTFEEPPEHVTFILLADALTPDLTTLASRSVIINFGEVQAEVIEAQLVKEGVRAERAHLAARGAHGSLTHARLLADDDAYLDRRNAFARVPLDSDGTGYRALALVDDIMQRIKDAASPLEEVFAQELSDLEARIKLTGERGGGRKALEESQKRRMRKHLTDELRNGLAVTAGVYRDAMSHSHNAHRLADFATAVEEIHHAMERLKFNVREELLLQSLFLKLPTVSPADLLTPVH
jgi:DNA polymerase-3 subunit delta'